MKTHLTIFSGEETNRSLDGVIGAALPFFGGCEVKRTSEGNPLLNLSLF